MTTTSHRFLAADAADLSRLSSGSIDLIVTSPPYPMIAMWDEQFAATVPAAATALAREDGPAAFEAMHRRLDAAWDEAGRLLRDGGFLCVNVGDAVRTVGGTFRLYGNHARIMMALEAGGFSLLPMILWRKPTNAPNKFMGSGMLPAGAYVTLEHEYIVIARKGPSRRPTAEAERQRRRRSAIFWEERNEWYSDVWRLAGVRQAMLSGRERERSAAFPLELPVRLVAMYSWQGDTVLDPFAGTGTTALAAIALGRHSIAADISADLLEVAKRRALEPKIIAELKRLPHERMSAHRGFLEGREKPPRHRNEALGFDVITSQETDLRFPVLAGVEEDETDLVARYEDDEPPRQP